MVGAKRYAQVNPILLDFFNQLCKNDVLNIALLGLFDFGKGLESWKELPW